MIDPPGNCPGCLQGSCSAPTSETVIRLCIRRLNFAHLRIVSPACRLFPDPMSGKSLSVVREMMKVVSYGSLIRKSRLANCGMHLPSAVIPLHRCPRLAFANIMRSGIFNQR